MRSPTLSILMAALVFAASTAPLAAEPTFVGIWYSAFQPDEPNVMSLIEFKADGTFYEEFRKCQNGDFVGYQTESGTWTYSFLRTYVKRQGRWQLLSMAQIFQVNPETMKVVGQ